MPNPPESWKVKEGNRTFDCGRKETGHKHIPDKHLQLPQRLWPILTRFREPPYSSLSCDIFEQQTRLLGNFWQFADGALSDLSHPFNSHGLSPESVVPSAQLIGNTVYA